MIKYASNDFLALKISYMNDIANLCELVGANIEDVAEGMKYDDRIGANFLKAGIGYGGSCFPKDTKALKYLAKQYGYTLKTVEAAVDVNTNQKVKLYKKACDRLITFNGLISIVPLIAALIYTIVTWNKKEKNIRLFSILVFILWFIYDILVKAYVSSITDIILIISNFLAFYKLDIKNNSTRSI